jgi:hypothetical protein
METIKKIKVTNEWDVPNQFVIYTNEGTYFQSYESIIAFIPKKYTVVGSNDMDIQLDETYWDYSRTTGKYRNKFLNETKKETEKKIKSGEYVLTDLN